MFAHALPSATIASTLVSRSLVKANSAVTNRPLRVARKSAARICSAGKITAFKIPYYTWDAPLCAPGVSFRRPAI